MPLHRYLRIILATMLVLTVLATVRPLPNVSAATLTFAVTSTADAPDASPGNGVCASTAGGACTLRAAIDEANAQPAGSTITITVPAGHYLLTLGELDLITNTITISGAGALSTTVDGGGASRVLHIFGPSVATIGLLAITGGHAGSGIGGGLLNEGRAVLVQNAFISNTSASGGGIANSGTLTLDTSTLTSNTIGAPVGPDGGNGGGVFNSGGMTITNSTFSGNIAGKGGSAASTCSISCTAGNGGNGGGVFNSGSMTIMNSTLTANVAGQGGYPTSCNFICTSGNGGNGGGVFNSGSMTITYGSLTGNLVGFIDPFVPPGTTPGTYGHGGGVYNAAATATALTLGSSIVAGSTGSSGVFDCDGSALTSQGYNLISQNTCGGLGVTDLTGQDPLLAPLADNGGPTQTMLPHVDSPVLDAIPVNLCAVSTDQRGVSRPQGTGCDIGAVEEEPAMPQVNAVSPAIGSTAGGADVVIQGANLLFGPRGATVFFGSQAASTVSAAPSGAVITVTSPATTTVGTVHVVVRTAGGVSPASPADQFTYVTPPVAWTVCPSGCLFQSIQMATDAASPGDIVSIGAGTYTETLFLDKSLSLTGAGANRTLIDAARQGTVLTVQAGGHVHVSGVSLQHGMSGASVPGGGIHNEGTLTLASSSVISNSTGAGANGGSGGNGGGVFNSGNMNIIASSLRANVTGSTDGTCCGDGGDGGAVFNSGNMNIIASALTGNATAGSIYLAGSGGAVFNSGSMTIVTSTLSSNATGGGNNTFTGADGGGVFNSGSMTIVASTVSSNTTGAGSVHIGSNYGGNGGGVFNSGSMTMTTSTLTGNATGRGGNSSWGGNGGNGGGVLNSGNLTIANSTLTGNVTGPGGNGSVLGGLGGIGGGVDNQGGTVTLSYSTISGNTALGGGGGIAQGGTMTGTIMAGNAPTNCGSPAAEGQGYNLDSGTSCQLTQTTDLTGTNPLLSPLANNGGPTPTQSLLPGSPAIDHGGSSANGCPATDQRGVSRPQGAACDIGAYEVDQAPRPTFVISPTNGFYQQPLTLAGTKYGPAETVIVYGGAPWMAPLYSATTNGAGTFVITRAVPAAPYGPHWLIAVGRTSGISVTATLFEQPLFGVRPISGTVGSLARATGIGFGNQESVKLWWDNPPQLVGTATTTAMGTFGSSTVMTFTVPANVALGQHRVYAVGQTTRATGIAEFTVH